MLTGVDAHAQFFQGGATLCGRYIIYIGFHMRMAFQIGTHKHKTGIFLTWFHGQQDLAPCMQPDAGQGNFFPQGFLFITH